MLLARRHPELVAGIVVQATAMDWRNTLRDRLLWRILPIAGSWLRSKGYRWYLNRAVPKAIGVKGSASHPFEAYVPWLVSEMSRNDPFVMVEAGRALSRYDARPWASSLGKPAASLVTTVDRAVAPSQQRALAAALGADVRELRADHFSTLSHPVEYAALTVELIELVRQRASAAAGRPRRRRRRPRGARRRLTVRLLGGQAVDATAQLLDGGQQLAELVAQLVAGDGVGEHQPDAGDLAGQELGVGPGALGDAAVELGLDAVAALLAVLGQQDERRRVRGLQRQHQGEQHEAAAPRVELGAVGHQHVPRDPDDDDERLPDQEPGRAEVAGDRLAEPAERVRVVLDVEAPVVARRREVLAALHHGEPIVGRSTSTFTPSWSGSSPPGAVAATPPPAGGRARRRP